jgi:hypothetical protein
MVSTHSRITVAGDICVDWLQFPMKAKDCGLNWELYPGTCLIAKPGGALLLAEFMRKSVVATVLSPVLEGIENLSPKQVIHSNAELELFPCSIDPKDKGKLVYRVKKFGGFVGPNKCAIGLGSIKSDDPDSSIVVLDDAGNGFRDSPECWPKAITENGKKPIVIYKMSRPIVEGKLWDQISKNHQDRLIVVVNADDLRSSGVNISRCLSWEKTALDFVWQLACNPKLLPLVNCSNLIVRFGLDGAIHYTRKNSRVSRLYFDPLTIEDEFKTRHPGEMQGLSSIFVTAIVSELALSLKNEEVSEIIPQGIRKGLSNVRRFFKYGFGGNVNQPDFPSGEFFAEEKDPENFADIIIPNPTVAEPADPTFWCILKEIKGTQLEDIAYDIVVNGEKKALGQVPVGQFKDLKTVDRAEIESFRGISNLMREYVGSKNPSRPLSIAVFGSPGSGKSFGIIQVANSIAPDLIEKIEFNVSQFNSPADLISALHRVRDIALSGKIPLVFFDEFDSAFGGKFGWLKYFLAPMQDGKFREGETMHPIGKSIFVFAGGICCSFAEFSCELKKNPGEELDEFRNAKGPDFISRLRGYVNILGPNCVDGSETLFVIRRAMLLRSFIERKAKLLLDNSNRVRIDQGVLRALIKVPSYRHGARSMEAIIDMSTLNERTCWEQAYLPPREQLKLHVDEEMFSRLVVRDVLLGAAREDLAKEIHKVHLEDQDGKRPVSDPSMHPWDTLQENLRESNRRQADHIPVKLRSVGYGFAPVVDRNPVIIEFTDPKEIEVMAELEHERWVSERLLDGWVYNKERDVEKKLSPYLVPWNELPEEVKDWDRRTVRSIPALLAKTKFEIYKLR